VPTFRSASNGTDARKSLISSQKFVIEEIVTVIDWLLDSDPSIRSQVMRDLTDAPAEDARGDVDVCVHQ